MRDIQQVLERWGGWAAQDHTAIGWSPIAEGFKNLVTYGSSTRLTCSDDDGLIIDSCACCLQQVRKSEELNVIMLYYVYGLSKREVRRLLKPQRVLSKAAFA